MNKSDLNKVEEYFFDNYYRVLVLPEDGKFIVSVDVYITQWNQSDQREICIENTCLLVKEINNFSPGIDQRVEKIIVIGVRVAGRDETINVKWILSGKPGFLDIEKLYKYSWLVARGQMNTGTS
ncbi:MAG: hypothetical protein QXE81_05430 [Desulfurococcaceae archaeon]